MSFEAKVNRIDRDLCLGSQIEYNLVRKDHWVSGGGVCIGVGMEFDGFRVAVEIILRDRPEKLRFGGHYSHARTVISC